MIRAFILLIVSAAALFAQPAANPPAQSAQPNTLQRSGTTHVDPSHMYYRVYASVPLIGKGTKEDPKRPMFIPSPAQIAARAPGDRSGILGFSFQLSDDKKGALVEFVAADRAAFQAMLSSTDPNVKCFERGKHSKAEIETEFKKHKAAFSFDSMQPVRVQ